MLKRYIHTLKYLRWQQIYFRLYYFLTQPKIRATALPALRSWVQFWNGARYISSRLSSEGTFLCLNQSGQIGDPLIWTHPKNSKLWLYHLHYFDSCNAKDVFERRPLIKIYIEKWITHNPSLQTPGWDPYPISLRIVNWILCFASGTLIPDTRWLTSMVEQANILMQRVEYHLLANHLLVNAKALIFLGCYFQGPDAERWLCLGLKILDQELPEQFLADGAHFELSPMYHALLLWDLCDLYHLAHCAPNTALSQRLPVLKKHIEQGVAWLTHMTHPDGEIAFFNDATGNAAPKLSDLQMYIKFLGLALPSTKNKSFSLHHLTDSGYLVVNLPHAGKVILDVGHLGPDYQPGHAHADTLSFELSLFKQRILVNSGISQYGTNPIRDFQRSTQAHNTVCLHAQNSSDVWSGFRVAKRAYPKNFSINTQTNHYMISCAHTGYVHHPIRSVHQRTWSIMPDSMSIVDTIQGKASNSIAYFYLHPELCIQEIGAQKFVIIVGDCVVMLEFVGANTVTREPSHWYPEFGVSVPNQRLSVIFKTHQLETKLYWLV